MAGERAWWPYLVGVVAHDVVGVVVAVEGATAVGRAWRLVAVLRPQQVLALHLTLRGGAMIYATT